MAITPAVKVTYGLAVMQPAIYCPVQLPKLTWRESLSGLIEELLFMFTQALLFAISVTGFTITARSIFSVWQ